MGNIDQNKHLFSRNKNKSILFLPLFGKRLLYAVTILIICDAFCDFGTCCGLTSSSENVILIDVTNLIWRRN